MYVIYYFTQLAIKVITDPFVQVNFPLFCFKKREKDCGYWAQVEIRILVVKS